MSKKIAANRKHCHNYSYLQADQLGKGFSSLVYRGKNDQTDEQVAIKLIDLRLLRGDVHKLLLSNEIEAMRSLQRSPNVVHLYDIYSEQQQTSIVMQLCEGGDLAKLIKEKGRLKQPEAIKILRQIARGYDDVYRKGYVHRDLKPANVFFSQGKAKIADFGFAVKLADVIGPTQYNVGSPVYMPLESLLHNQYSPKSDIWAIGVIFYEMLTGKTPWRAKTETDLKRQLKISNIGGLLPKDLSERSADFLIKALNSVLADRMNPDQLMRHRVMDDGLDGQRENRWEIKDHKWEPSRGVQHQKDNHNLPQYSVDHAGSTTHNGKIPRLNESTGCAWRQRGYNGHSTTEDVSKTHHYPNQQAAKPLHSTLSTAATQLSAIAGVNNEHSNHDLVANNHFHQNNFKPQQVSNDSNYKPRIQRQPNVGRAQSVNVNGLARQMKIDEMQSVKLPELNGNKSTNGNQLGNTMNGMIQQQQLLNKASLLGTSNYPLHPLNRTAKLAMGFDNTNFPTDPSSRNSQPIVNPEQMNKNNKKTPILVALPTTEQLYSLIHWARFYNKLIGMIEGVIKEFNRNQRNNGSDSKVNNRQAINKLTEISIQLCQSLCSGILWLLEEQIPKKLQLLSKEGGGWEDGRNRQDILKTIRAYRDKYREIFQIYMKNTWRQEIAATGDSQGNKTQNSPMSQQTLKPNNNKSHIPVSSHLLNTMITSLYQQPPNATFITTLDYLLTCKQLISLYIAQPLADWHKKAHMEAIVEGKIREKVTQAEIEAVRAKVRGVMGW